MVKTYECVRDVLDHAKAFHGELKEKYDALEHEASAPRVKMLLDYLSRHEAHLQESLSDFEEDASAQILDTWFKYVPSEAQLQQISQIKLDEDMSIRDVVETALRMDNLLVDLYRDVAEVAVTDDVKAVFTNLLALEEREKHRMVRNSLMAEDL